MRIFTVIVKISVVIYTDYQRDANKRKLGCHRFDYNQSFGGKITKQVEYTEYLNLRPYMTSQVRSACRQFFYVKP